VSEILSQFHEEDLPMSTVDISAAVQAGRRRRRIRTVLAAGATVVALAAGALTANALIGRPQAMPPANPGCGSPTPARPAQPTWQRFDPLVSEIDASGVAGYRVTVVATSTYFQAVQLSSSDRSVTVILYACGGEPHGIVEEEIPVNPANGEPADPVRGVPAYWLPPDRSATVALAWQWTSGAWVFLAASGVDENQQPPESDLRAVATQVAPQLEFGAGTPVTAPFSLPIPDGVYPATTVTFRASDFGREFPVSFNMGFDAIGRAAPTHVFAYVPDLWVNANAFARVEDLPAHATEYSEDLGHPAYRYDLRDEGRDSDVLQVFDVFGFGVEIEPRGLPGTSEETLAIAADIFRTVTIYPGAAENLSAWGNPVAS
jgi:hypothetical protein